MAVDWDGAINLWLTFCPPDRRRRDDDNMLAAFKAGRDGLADALKIDDARFVLHVARGQPQAPGYVLVRLAP